MKIYILLLPILSALSCVKEYAPEFKDERQKLVLFAELDVQNGLKVFVSKTASTKNKVFTDTLKVTDAQVFVVDSVSNTRILIPHDSGGVYFAKPIFYPDHFYKIEAFWKQHIASSEYLGIPLLPNDIKVVRTIEERDHVTNRLTNLQYLLTFTANINEQFFDFSFYKNSKLEYNLSLEDYFCKNIKTKLINSICNSGMGIKWKLGNSAINLLYNKKGEPHKGNFYVYMSTVSDSYYKYLLSTVEPEPVERLFLPPNQTYTNMRQGLGLFYIRNSIIDTISID